MIREYPRYVALYPQKSSYYSTPAPPSAKPCQHGAYSATYEAALMSLPVEHQRSRDSGVSAHLAYLERQTDARQAALRTPSVITADKILHQGAAWANSHRKSASSGNYTHTEQRKKSHKHVRFETFVTVHVMNEHGHVGTMSEPINFEPRDREDYVRRCRSRCSLREIEQRTGYDDSADDQDYDNIPADVGQDRTVTVGCTDKQINEDFRIPAQTRPEADDTCDYDDPSDIISYKTDKSTTTVGLQTAPPMATNTISHTSDVSGYTPVADNDHMDYANLEDSLTTEVTSLPMELTSHPTMLTSLPTTLTSFPTELTSPLFKFDKDPTHGLCLSFSLPLGVGYSTNDIVVETSDTTSIRVVASSKQYGRFDKCYTLPMAIESSLVEAKRDREGNLLVSAPLMGGKLIKG